MTAVFMYNNSRTYALKLRLEPSLPEKFLKQEFDWATWLFCSLNGKATRLNFLQCLSESNDYLGILYKADRTRTQTLGALRKSGIYTKIHYMNVRGCWFQIWQQFLMIPKLSNFVFSRNFSVWQIRVWPIVFKNFILKSTQVRQFWSQT